MRGLIAGAMAGGGEGLARAGQMLGEHASRSFLQQEMAELQRLRDERLAELRKGEIEYGEQLRRKPGMEAAKDIEAARTGLVDDPSGTMRQRTPAEMAEAEEGAYRKQGLVGEAMQVRSLEQQRGRDVQTTLDRTADNTRAERQLDEQQRHSKAIEQIQREQLKATREGFTLQPLGDGRIAKVTKDGKVDYLRDPSTGEALIGGKDLPAATKALVDVNKAIIVANERRMENAMPDEQQRIGAENQRLKAEIDQLLGHKGGGGGPGPSGEDPLGIRPKPKAAAEKPKPAPAAPGTPAQPKPATPSAPAEPSYAQFVKQRRSGHFIEAPRTSPAWALNGRSFSTRAEALKALSELDAYKTK